MSLSRKGRSRSRSVSSVSTERIRRQVHCVLSYVLVDDAGRQPLGVQPQAAMSMSNVHNHSPAHKRGQLDQLKRREAPTTPRLLGAFVSQRSA